MITNKNINKIIVIFVLIAIIFTTIFMLYPQALGIKPKSSEPQYAEKLFNKDEIISIKIHANPEQWAEMLENAADEEYIPCDITIQGETYYSVGIRPKGNSSLSMVADDPDTDRYSFKIKMDEYVEGQNYYGLSKFVMNNMQGDATYMKEYLSYDMFEYLGVKTPLYAFSEISVNEEPWGFYLAIEVVEEEFAQRTYGVDYGELYKPETMDMGGGGKREGNQADKQRPEGVTGGGIDFNGGSPPNMQQGERPVRPEDTSGGAMEFGGGMPGGFGAAGGAVTGADLAYINDDVDSYSQIFDNAVFKTSKSDQERVVKALKALSTGEELEKYVDVDQVLRYFAVNTSLVNLDSYICSFMHNYYIYEKEGQISILPWDLNLSFAGFQVSNATLAVNFPIDTPVAGVELSSRPLIANLLKNDLYKEEYHRYLQELVDGYFNSGYFEDSINKLDALIGEHVKNDSSAFYTYDQYIAGVDTLKEYGRLRAESIQGQINGTIPSTEEGQTKNPDRLIDASNITISTMGSQGNGGDVDKRTVFKNQSLPPKI